MCQDLPLICIGHCNLCRQLSVHTTATTFSARAHTRPGTLLQVIAWSCSPTLHAPHFQFWALNLNKSLRLRPRPRPRLCLRLRRRRSAANRSCPKQRHIRGCPCRPISASSPPTDTSECRCYLQRQGPGQCQCQCQWHYPTDTPQISTRRILRNRPLPPFPAHCRRRRGLAELWESTLHPVCRRLIFTPPATDTSRAGQAIKAVSAAASPFQRLHTLVHATTNQLNHPP